MGGFTYGNETNRLLDYELSVKNEFPYKLKFSGCVRPYIIFKFLIDVIGLDNACPYPVLNDYIVDRVIVNSGGFDVFELRLRIKEFITFNIEKYINQLDLKFTDRFDFIKIDRKSSDYIAGSHNAQILDQNGEILKIKSFDLRLYTSLDKKDESFVIICGRQNDTTLYDLNKIKIITRSVDGSKITGIFECDVEYRNKYEREYFYKLNEITNVEYF